MIHKSVQALFATMLASTVGMSPAITNSASSSLNPLPETLQQRQKVSVDHLSAERAFDSGSGKMVLVLHYAPPEGSPQEKSARLAAWVSLNGRDGLFGMKRNEGKNVFDLELSNTGYNCGPATARGSECDETTRTMQNIFYWARRGDPSNPNGKLNAWDIEAAFVTPEGAWDNANGRNYRLRFKE